MPRSSSEREGGGRARRFFVSFSSLRAAPLLGARQERATGEELHPCPVPPTPPSLLPPHCGNLPPPPEQRGRGDLAGLPLQLPRPHHHHHHHHCTPPCLARVCVCVPLQPPPNLFQLTIAPAGVGRGNEGTRFVRSVLANFYVGHVQPLIFLLLCVCARACVSCCLRRRRARLCARIATHPGRRRLQPTSREWGLENDDEGFRRGSRRLLHKNGRDTSRLLALSPPPGTVVPGSVPVS